MKSSIVDFDSVSHRYTRDWAVDDVSFKIQRNSITGLLGSNGAGKSTCINIICGTLSPTLGDVRVDSFSVVNDPLLAKRQIGFLPQDAPLHLMLTVGEYLNHCGVIRGIERHAIKQAVDYAMEKCGVSHFRDRLIGNLSGGYRQRVGLAQAILHQPSLVVLDEPTNGLDPNQIASVRELIREIAKDKTVLLSTHILSEVEVICHDIKMIERGKLVFDGSLSDFNRVIEPSAVLVSFRDSVVGEKFESIPSVISVSFLNEERIRINFSGGSEIVDGIIEFCTAKKLGIREINFVESTLEQVFASLSEE